MDITETTAPKSDQQQFDDFIGGITRTVTVSGVSSGSLEQPVNIELAEFPGRPFRPNKTMRRLLVVAWGKDSAAYIGRRLELFGNPDVIWAGKPVGGVEIRSLSNIDKPLTIPLTVSRGKKKSFTVQPLPTTPTTKTPTLDNATINEWSEVFGLATTLPALQAAWEQAKSAGVITDARIVAAKNARKSALT